MHKPVGYCIVNGIILRTKLAKKNMSTLKKRELHAYICLVSFHEETAPEDVCSHIRSLYLCGSDGFRHKNRERNLQVMSHNSGIVIKSN